MASAIRRVKVLPRRGRIGIFNRSYYEEVLIARVSPEVLARQNLPGDPGSKDFWERRYEDIRAMERHLVRNGTLILKFFLHISKKEQKKRLLERLDSPEKNWKFSPGDLKTRALWGRYQEAYEEMLNHTSTKGAPWYIIPADHKWFTRIAVAGIIVSKLAELDLHPPRLNKDQLADIGRYKRLLKRD